MGFPILIEKANRSTTASSRAQVQELLREILHYLPDSPRPARRLRNGKTQELLLSIQVDGERYTLLRTGNGAKPSGNDYQLSPREQEITRLVAKGFPNKAIGSLLDISPWTVATHLRRIFAKLSVSSRTEMVAKVMKEGLLDQASQ
jgi:DNA-binding CsgD family transcriptional regulator